MVKNPHKIKSNSVENIALNLCLLIKHHGLSIRKLGRIINVANPHLLRLSKGDHASPGLKILEKIAKFFQISVSQLIGEQKIYFKNLPKNLEQNFDEE